MESSCEEDNKGEHGAKHLLEENLVPAAVSESEWEQYQFVSPEQVGQEVK